MSTGNILGISDLSVHHVWLVLYQILKMQN